VVEEKILAHINFYSDGTDPPCCKQINALGSLSFLPLTQFDSRQISRTMQESDSFANGASRKLLRTNRPIRDSSASSQFLSMTSTPPQPSKISSIFPRASGDMLLPILTSKRRWSSPEEGEKSPSKIRRKMADMMMQASTLSLHSPTIDEACKRFQEENKFSYRSEYTITTGVPFLSLNYDVYAIILEYLTGDRTFDITAHMPLDNAAKALRCVNQQMNAITREWMTNSLRLRLKPHPRLPYHETLPLTQHFKFLISPSFGVFNPSTSNFFLDAAYMDNASQSDLVVERQLLFSRITLFSADTVHAEGVQNIKLRVRSVADLQRFITSLIAFQNLQSVEITVENYSHGSHSNDFGYYAWDAFWKSGSWCHPGKCCTCSQLPELTVVETYSSEPKVIPVPLRESDESYYKDAKANEDADAVQVRVDKWYNQGF
jgi:hypothetical protein